MRSKTAGLLLAAVAAGLGIALLARSPSDDDRTAAAVRQLDTPAAADTLRRKEKARQAHADRMAWVVGTLIVAVVAEAACRVAGLGRRPNTDITRKDDVT
jgi:hypothetical protein